MPAHWVDYFNQELAKGLVVTLEVLVVATVTTVLWGLVVAVLRVSGVAPLRWIASAYIELFRGTPLIVQILLVFAYLPSVGIRFPPFQTAILVLTLNAGSYMAEFYRAGLQAVPKGQIEAAVALSMSRLVVFRRVIAPLTLRVVLPAIGTLAIMMLLSTSFVFLLGLQDLMARGGLIHGRTSDFSVYLEITAIYIILGAALTAATHWLERRLRLP